MEKLRFEKWIDKNRTDGVGGIKFYRNSNDNQYFEIMFGGNLDLYFCLNGLEDGTTFLIGKDNYEVYEIFDELYHTILSGYPYAPENLEDNWRMRECTLFGEDYFETLKMIEEDREETQNKNLQLAMESGLIEEDEIVWRSDDYSRDSAPYFVIKPRLNAYEIKFEVPKINRNLSFEETLMHNDYKYKLWISVRLRNSGSRYEPFNQVFMRAYNKLMELEPVYHQIHVEEFMIDQKLAIGEKLERILTKNK